MTVRHGLALLGLAAAFSPPAAADVTVSPGATFDLGDAELDLGCGDLMVEGEVGAGTGNGIRGANDVTIVGTLDGQSGTIELAGDWSNTGSFVPGSSTVQIMDGCGQGTSVVSGSSAFAELKVTSSSGKLVQLESGSTQTVTAALTLMGADGSLLELRSTSTGVEAFVDLQGSQDVAFVDVDDSHATGSPILLGPESTRGPNTDGWILGAAVPVLTQLGLGLLAAGSVWGARLADVPESRVRAATSRRRTRRGDTAR